MKELHAVIQIAAPLDTVWRVLTDFEHWTDWNPMVNQASGSASVGSPLHITMRGPDAKDGMTYKPIVMESNPPKTFRWRATMMGSLMFTNDRVFELRTIEGGTELTNTEEFRGLMVPLFWNVEPAEPRN